MTEERALPPSLSLYLDAVRFTAALVVFISHFGTRLISGGLLYQFDWFSPAAVDVFFVLSGFIIASAVATREHQPLDYATRRAARIISVVIPAMVLSAVLDNLGGVINPDFYLKVPSFEPASQLTGYLASMLFLNQAWFFAFQPGSNGPYWSIGFEVWYYVFFGFAAFARGKWAWAGMAGVMLLGGPKLLLLLPVWFAGVLAWRCCRGPAPPQWLAGGLALLPFVCLVLWRGWIVRSWEPYRVYGWEGPANPGVYNHYLVGLAFAVHFVGVRWVNWPSGILPAWLVRAIRWLAAGTFGLYLFHYPLVHFLAAVLPWPPASLLRRVAIGLVAPILILVLANWVERHKVFWRRVILGALHRVTAR